MIGVARGGEGVRGCQGWRRGVWLGVARGGQGWGVGGWVARGVIGFVNIFGAGVAVVSGSDLGLGHPIQRR